MPKKNGSTPPANTPELSRLHRLTQEESDLVFDFRVLSQEAKEAVLSLARAMTCNDKPRGDNVVSLRTAG
jgi:hypothetical protein